MEEIPLPLKRGSLDSVQFVEAQEQRTEDSMEIDTLDTQEAQKIYEVPYFFVSFFFFQKI